jgi:uncharacterized protein (TIRG00374 family)
LATVSPEKQKKDSSPLFLVKLLVGLSLIGLLFWQVDLTSIFQLFSKINIKFIALLVLMAFALNLVSCLKWKLFLQEYGNTISVFRLLSLYFIGKFFNNFFPSTVGGDIARSYILGKQIQSKRRSFASVILERLTGFIALNILAFIFALMNIQLLKVPVIAISFSVVGGSTIVLAVVLLFPQLLDTAFNAMPKIPLLVSAMNKFRILLQELAFFKGKYMLLAKSMGYSFIFHSMTIVQVYLVCRAIGFFPDFLDIALITPIILAITALPLTPNKLGIWEWAFGVFLVQAGGEMVEGVTVALVLRGLGLSISVIGGILLIFENMTKHDQSINNNIEQDRHGR